MDSVADSGTGGDAPPPITGASTDREDEDAGMGLLADGRRRREPQTITRPVPALIRAAQAPASGTLTRPWVSTRQIGSTPQRSPSAGRRSAWAAMKLTSSAVAGRARPRRNPPLP